MAAGSIEIGFSQDDLSNAIKLLGEIRGGVTRAVVGSINDVLRIERTRMSRRIREYVNIKAKDLKPHIKITRSTRSHLFGVLKLSKSRRLPLSYFGARQTKVGVTYRIDRRKGRSTAPSAFIVESRGGHVFKRSGRTRLPIYMLKGVSPWGAYVINPNIARTSAADINDEMQKQLRRRIQFELAKAAGKVRSRRRAA